MWLVYHAKNTPQKFDEKLPKPIQKLIALLAATPAAIQVMEVIVNWLGHLASDVAGSSNAARKGKRGMGIGGVFLSMLKELSSLPPLNTTNLPKAIDDMYQNDHLDLRAELGMLKDIGKFIGKQAIPVMGGEILVRTFYFVRHLIQELNENKEINLVNWQNVLPFGNRTIARMMTIESAVFTAFDLADASIRSAIKNKTPQNPLFWKDLIFSINFVGIGRCVIAIGNDLKMGHDKKNVLQECIDYKCQLLTLRNAKVFIFQNNMWVAAEKAEDSLKELYACADQVMPLIDCFVHKIGYDFENLPTIMKKIEDKNPQLLEDIGTILNN